MCCKVDIKYGLITCSSVCADAYRLSCLRVSLSDRHAHTCSQELPVVKYKCYRLHIEPGMQQQQCVHARVVRDQDINMEPECEHVQLSEMQ